MLISRSGAIALLAGLALLHTAPSSAAEAQADSPAHMEMTIDGPILVASSGMALYVNGADTLKRGTSVCADKPTITYPDPGADFGTIPVIGHKLIKACADKWPPYFAAPDAKPVGDFRQRRCIAFRQHEVDEISSVSGDHSLAP